MAHFRTLALVTSVFSLSVSAPAFADSSDLCFGSVTELSRLCDRDARGAGGTLLAAQLRGGTSKGAINQFVIGYNRTAEAGRICAMAGNVSRAEKLAEQAAHAATAEIFSRNGVSSETTPVVRCGDEAPRDAALRAFDDFRQALRSHQLAIATHVSCRGEALPLARQTSAAIQDRKCLWAMETARSEMSLLAEGHNLSSADASMQVVLRALEVAQRACPDRVSMIVRDQSAAVAELLKSGTRSEAAEIRGALLEEGGDRFRELLRLESLGEELAFGCDTLTNQAAVAIE